MAVEIISGERAMTLAEANRRAARAATGFAALGVAENDTVALMLRNDFAFFEASIAAGLIGAYATPINWHFTPEETKYVLRDSGAKLLIVHADILPRVAAGIPPEVTVLAVPTPPEIRAAYGLAGGEEMPAEVLRWDRWLEGHGPLPDQARPPRGSMIYTSGTTGHPKGVRRQPSTPEQTERTQALIGIVFGFTPDTEFRVLMTGPMYHSAPNAFGLYAAGIGGGIVLQPRFDAEQMLALIERHRITHMHMVPTMFVRLLKLPDAVRQRYDLSSLRFVVHGAAPCPPQVKAAMIEWWGPVINEYYGSTETGIVVFATAADAAAKPGSVGRVVPGGTVAILDREGEELGPGEEGEVFVGLESMSDFTYYGRDQARREIERRGLVTVGDIGYFDDDGYLFLCDRKNDMVISGGVNIYPAEIEAVLHDMPGVADCAVFGIPDDEFGEALCAHVQPSSGARFGAQEVRTYLKAHVAGYKVPRLVEIVATLPREDTGKLFKRKLREPYWRDAGRQI